MQFGAERRRWYFAMTCGAGTWRRVLALDKPWSNAVDIVYLCGVAGLVLLTLGLAKGCAALERGK